MMGSPLKKNKQQTDSGEKREKGNGVGMGTKEPGRKVGGSDQGYRERSMT